MSFVRGETLTGSICFNVFSITLRTLGWYFVSIGILALGTRSISPNVTVGRANSISEAGTLNAIPFSSLK